MFDWLFKRSAKDPKKGESFIESKSSNAKSLTTDEQTQLKQTEQDLIHIRDTLPQVLGEMANKIASLQEELEQLKNQDSLAVNEVQASGEHKLALAKELEELRVENNTLLSGMFEAQEELERQLLALDDLKQNKSILDQRFERFMKRLPAYVDCRQINIISFDNIAVKPEIVWEMSDVIFSGITYEKIQFKTLLSEGKVGIWIMSFTKDGGKSAAFKNTATLFPELLKTEIGQERLLRLLRTSHWRAFGAAIAMIDHCIKSQWRDLVVPPEFDTQFWSSCFQSLSRDFQQLPKILFFEEAKLKQELVNPDYEHLWFELLNVNFGNLSLPKFEFRLSATQVHAKQFSKYPKLEIPLIDGKSKPFEGWYPESFDDFGDKFELRFNLNSMAVDVAVLSKLPKTDREFIFGLVISLPNILASINNSNKNLNSPIGSWIQIANEMFKVMNTLSVNSRNQQKPKIKDELVNPSTEIGIKSVAIDEDKQASKDSEMIPEKSINQDHQNLVTKTKTSVRKSRVRNAPSNTALDLVANSKQKK